MTAPFPVDEEARLAALGSLNILDTPPEQAFDGLAEIARTILNVPVAFVSLVDRDRQWFKAKRGADLCETPRCEAFCAHAILEAEPLIVADTTLDPRFADNPNVEGGLGVRFYAGAPIFVEGHALGTVCGIDHRPRTPDERQRAALVALAEQAAALLETRRNAAHHAERERRLLAFLDHAPIGAFLKDAQGRYLLSNGVFDQAVGRTTEETQGGSDHALFPPAAAEGYCGADALVCATGRPLMIEEDVPTERGEIERWRTFKFPVRLDGETYVGGVGIDLSALRNAEEALEARNEDLAQALQEAETARAAAQTAAARFEGLFDGLPVACFTYGEAGTIHEWNAAAEALWSIPSEEALLGSIYDTVVGPENRAAKETVVRRVFAGEAVHGHERRETMRDGRERWLLTSTFPLRTPSGAIVGAVSANVDITERRQAETAARASEARFRTVVESLHEGLVVQDAAGRVSLWNRSAERILGILGEAMDLRSAGAPRSQAIREDGSDFPIEERPVALAIQNGHPHEATIGNRQPNGTVRWHSVIAAPLPAEDGGPGTTAVASFLDVTDRVEQARRTREHLVQIEAYSKDLEAANGRLEALATTDGLTGLKNHRFFQDFLRRKVDQCGPAGFPLSVVLLDVDRFKSYNDDFGHQAGDAVLRDVARALEGAVRKTDLVARYGGEEFVIVMPGLDAAGSLVMADRVRERLAATPFDLRMVTASFGVATLGRFQPDATSLIRAADEALYRSKAAGRNRATHWNSDLGDAAVVSWPSTDRGSVLTAATQGEGAGKTDRPAPHLTVGGG